MLKKLSCICLVLFQVAFSFAQPPRQPNIILIYADDLGYGDVGANGAVKVKTPNIDNIAKRGIRFTNAHASSATCTPSRFSLLTGRYAWRRQGTNIAPGDAALIIPTNMATLPGMLQNAGYKTAVVGKWHLGLGPAGGPDWNADINPGPLEVGFGYSFIMPATGDRVPCVYLENHRIVDSDPADPIQVNYKQKIGNEPTGSENPELLKIKPSHGHDNTIVNGVSRIGWMSGGKKARWIDEDLADVLTNRAAGFIENQKDKPFFLYLSTHDIHVPRLPHARFAGKSGMGPRGDAILQLDWTVGEIMKTLDKLNLARHTMVIFTSDNGPVLDDGYQDQAVTKLNGHQPAGPLRGGKYSAFDGGTRVPLFISFPGRIKAGTVSDALVSQLDFFASFAKLTGQQLSGDEASDSFDALDVLMGKSKKNRSHLVEHALNGTLSIIVGDWKYIAPSKGVRRMVQTNIETGYDTIPQLYHLKTDIAERRNLAGRHPDKAKALEALLTSIRERDISRKQVKGRAQDSRHDQPIFVDF